MSEEQQQQQEEIKSPNAIDVMFDERFDIVAKGRAPVQKFLRAYRTLMTSIMEDSAEDGSTIRLTESMERYHLVMKRDNTDHERLQVEYSTAAEDVWNRMPRRACSHCEKDLVDYFHENGSTVIVFNCFNCCCCYSCFCVHALNQPIFDERARYPSALLCDVCGPPFPKDFPAINEHHPVCWKYQVFVLAPSLNIQVLRLILMSIESFCILHAAVRARTIKNITDEKKKKRKREAYNGELELPLAPNKLGKVQDDELSV